MKKTLSSIQNGKQLILFCLLSSAVDECKKKNSRLQDFPQSYFIQFAIVADQDNKWIDWIL